MLCVYCILSNGLVNVNTLSPTQISHLGTIKCISFNFISFIYIYIYIYIYTHTHSTLQPIFLTYFRV